jgi:protein involved in polysaccharide export with SLBB domain
VTNLRSRLDNVLAELAVIREALNNPSRYPFCCLKVYNDGKISCDAIGPLPEAAFLRECEECQAEIKRKLALLNLKEDETKDE